MRCWPALSSQGEPVRMGRLSVRVLEAHPGKFRPAMSPQQMKGRNRRGLMAFIIAHEFPARSCTPRKGCCRRLPCGRRSAGPVKAQGPDQHEGQGRGQGPVGAAVAHKERGQRGCGHGQGRQTPEIPRCRAGPPARRRSCRAGTDPAYFSSVETQARLHAHAELDVDDVRADQPAAARPWRPGTLPNSDRAWPRGPGGFTRPAAGLLRQLLRQLGFRPPPGPRRAVHPGSCPCPPLAPVTGGLSDRQCCCRSKMNCCPCALMRPGPFWVSRKMVPRKVCGALGVGS